MAGDHGVSRYIPKDSTMPGDNDDDWAELARELASDKHQPASAEWAADEKPDSPDQAAAGGTTLPGDGAEPADGAPEGEDPLGDPGPGRKRRRRRRRRRRGGSEQLPEAAGESGPSEGEETVDTVESEAGGEEMETAEVGFADEGEPELDAELLPVDGDSEEEAGEDLLRDLVANWNVPSWDDVVGGLYRPER